jgi:cellulose synthase/poly-beta-1,6-N-acetylglucosamine synthase-like glycosyltransferase
LTENLREQKIMVASVILIVSLALIVYTYVGYPALVYVLSRLFGRRVKAADITPKLSVIIAAYNEERDIARKIEETLALDYPKDKLEIIVASDCSTDRTDEIVKGFANRGVILHRRPERLGKTSAQNHAMQVSTGEILVFSDATTRYEPDTLLKIVRSFADPEVGCVTGNVVYVDRSATAVGMGLRSYWGYEFFIKQAESSLGSLLGVCGCLYAVRRSAYVQLDQDMSSDFVIASEVHLQGLRVVYDPEAISSEDTNKRSHEEFRMRVRIVEQTMSALCRYRRVLNLRKHKMFAFQMICHKALRYAVPFLLIIAFGANLLLLNAGAIYRLAFIGQAAFYLLAMIGWLCDRVGLKLGPLAFPYYFVLSNAASLVAFKKFVSGESHVTWEPMRDSKLSGKNADYPATNEGLVDGRSVS